VEEEDEVRDGTDARAGPMEEEEDEVEDEDMVVGNSQGTISAHKMTR
jgi:hypothetical protein